MRSATHNRVAEVGAIPLEAERNRPFRVLYFDHTAMLGGGEIALLNLVRHLSRECVIPVVVLGSDGPLADQLRSICEVHILSLPERVGKTKKETLAWRSLLELGDIATVVSCSFKLARFAVKHEVDLIHTNSLKSDIIGGLAGKLARRPVVWHVRDRIDSDYLPKVAVRVFRLLCAFIPSFVIANSEATLKTLHLRRTQSKTSNSSGVELSKTSRVVHDATIVPSEPVERLASEHQAIGLIGRICPWKGQHIFLQAAASVHSRFPKARFKIIGAALFGEDEYEVKVRQLCADLELDDVVEFSGFCSNVTELIAGLDLVVHASTTGEPFGLVIIEAMAASKPVVATNGGGVPEIVVDDTTGLLVPMGDAPAMADAICRILADPDLGRRMGSQGFLRVRELFAIGTAVRKIEAVYRQILRKNQSS